MLLAEHGHQEKKCKRVQWRVTDFSFNSITSKI